jgi:hypothetical protein
MTVYTTAFDKGYLTRGIAMIESLLSFQGDARISVLCLDLETRLAVQAIQTTVNISIIHLSDLGGERIQKIRSDREYREFCWTLGALLCDFHLRMNEKEVVYLDADILFFSSPEILLQEARSGDVAAIKHRFPSRLQDYEINGMFNVQWVYFSNSAVGRKAAARWAEQCVLSCSYQPEIGIVGDQKYLDEWPDLYPTFVEILTPGAGIAPWNHETFRPFYSDKGWKVKGGSDLIFYHFHGLKILSSGDVQLAGPIYSDVCELPLDLYEHYLDQLAKVAGRYPNLLEGPKPSTWRIQKRRGLVRRLIVKLGEEAS